VNLHPGPPRDVSFDTHSLGMDPDGSLSRSQPMWALQLGLSRFDLRDSGTQL